MIKLPYNITSMDTLYRFVHVRFISEKCNIKKKKKSIFYPISMFHFSSGPIPLKLIYLKILHFVDLILMIQDQILTFLFPHLIFQFLLYLKIILNHD